MSKAKAPPDPNSPQMLESLAILRGQRQPPPPPAPLLSPAQHEAIAAWPQLREVLAIRCASLQGSKDYQAWVETWGWHVSLGDALGAARMNTGIGHYHDFERVRRAKGVPIKVAETAASFVGLSLTAWDKQRAAVASTARADVRADAGTRKARVVAALQDLFARILTHGARVAPLVMVEVDLIPTASPNVWQVGMEPIFCGGGYATLTFSRDFGHAEVRCSCGSVGGSGSIGCSTLIRVVEGSLESILNESIHNATVFVDRVAREPHERLLRRLDVLTAPAEDDAVAIGWRFKDDDSDVRAKFTPVRVAETRTGKLRLKQLTWKTLDDFAALLQPIDAEIALLLRMANAPYPPGASVATTGEAHGLALRKLVGHPWVFVDQAKEPSPVVEAPVALALEATPAGARLRATVAGEQVDGAKLAHALREGGNATTVVVQQGEGSVVRVITASPRLRATLAELDVEGVELPAATLPTLRARLGPLSKLAPLVADEALLGQSVIARPEPWLRLSLTEAGGTVDGLSLHAELCARPLGEGAFVVPGEGEALHFAVGGSTQHTRRDLDAERKAAQAMADALGMPALAATLHAESALELVATAGELPGLQVVWERGSLRARRGRVERARVQVQSRTDWLAIGGKLEIDGASTELSDALAALREGRRWVRLGKAGWTRLEGELADALQSVALRLEGTGDAAKLPALAAELLEAMEAHGAELHGDRAWVDRRARLREARSLPGEPPEGLEATLRDYQREGIAWLQRLAHWAPGGVLADDMGLGKTLQALALLLARAENGPSLVVAPTSLGFGWAREAAQFAPDLNIVAYRGSDRVDSLGRIGPGDVLVTSYDLMLRDAEALAAVTFTTLVFDEAQALKNPQSLRARAAASLRADFRLALSGTPVENRASDLWSILRATAPGLLPGWERFRRDYAAPIERSAEGPARRALAALVGPFVLRRRKADVLRELPDRVEVRADVALSQGERKFYDTLRRDALNDVAHGSPEQKRFAVLAALTRLRQAACHPRLVDPESRLPSAKHERLREIIAELRDEGQQALVFSQFVRQLELAREALTADGVRLLQLDGSTPAARRGGIVDAFQAGGADVLLISLKAGGTGLNLTAATTVVLLDPWWNPAVEAQAGDRAHRIGQDQPVTIVRLVALGTVEDAILSLQADKRALTEALLSGADGGAKLDADALFALLSADSPDGALAIAEAAEAAAAAMAAEAGAGAGARAGAETDGTGGVDAEPAVVSVAGKPKRPRKS